VGQPGQSAPLILVTLQDAVRDRSWILLGYVDQQGAPSNRIVRPTAMDGGWLTAWDERSGAPRRFVLHRVTGVTVVPGGGGRGGSDGGGGGGGGDHESARRSGGWDDHFDGRFHD
jgi:hypothetical protein